MNTIFLILGSNKGDRLLNLQEASRLIEKKTGMTIKRSDVFVTAAWGNTDQSDFYNQAIHIESDLEAGALLTNLLNIEEQLGRVRTEQKWIERTIDIDILFYNDEIIDQPQLKIPHPHIQERKFVLVPLAQLKEDLIHPIFNKTIAQLLTECSDTLNVKKLLPE